MVQQLCRLLDEQDIEQMLWGEYPPCPTCGDDRYGLLDESRVTLPFPAGPFQGRTNLAGSLRPMNNSTASQPFLYSLNTGPHVDNEMRRYASYTPYMVIMDIVRSGMFSEDQLLYAADAHFSGMHFSRHELEVNAVAFKAARPPTCSCTGWGSPTMSDCGEEFNLPVEPGLEVDNRFIDGHPVRTGYRLRSPEARRKRAKKKHLRRCVFITPDATVVVKTAYRCIPAPSEVCLNLSFKYIPHGEDLRTFQYRMKAKAFKRDPRVKSPRSAIKRGLFVRRVPFKGHTKYWYYLRKVGGFRLSEHHPLNGDHLYVRLGFKKPNVPMGSERAQR